MIEFNNPMFAFQCNQAERMQKSGASRNLVRSESTLSPEARIDDNPMQSCEGLQTSLIDKASARAALLSTGVYAWKRDVLQMTLLPRCDAPHVLQEKNSSSIKLVVSLSGLLAESTSILSHHLHRPPVNNSSQTDRWSSAIKLRSGWPA